MYPSIKYNLVKKEVDYFNRKISKKGLMNIKKYLELIKHAISSNILTFCRKYYKYNGSVSIK